jgi:AcrR family transcriptional regulator
LNERSSKWQDDGVREGKPSLTGGRAGSAGPSPATRDRIVETALRLFSEKGTSAVSMRELADATGVTVPGIYYHFASKADLIQAVYHAARGATSDDATEATVVQSHTVEARIVEQAAREFARLVDDAEFLRLMQREAVLGDAEALEVGAALSDEWRSRWRVVLTESDDVAPDADVAAAADVIATFLWGLFVEYLNHHDPTVAGRIEAFAGLVAPALQAPTLHRGER